MWFWCFLRRLRSPRRLAEYNAAERHLRKFQDFGSICVRRGVGVGAIDGGGTQMSAYSESEDRWDFRDFGQLDGRPPMPTIWSTPPMSTIGLGEKRCFHRWGIPAPIGSWGGTYLGKCLGVNSGPLPYSGPPPHLDHFGPNFPLKVPF